MSALRERWDGWWFQAEAPGRAALFRFVFFTILALDCWLNLPHLARYGAGHFNVSHLALLDPWLPAPEAGWVVAVFLLCGWLALRVAFGVATRLSLSLLSVLYALAYFGSQLDSYQHHYLVAALLLVLAAAMWVDRVEELPDWSLKLSRVLLANMYLWAGITKMEPLWVDGRTLQIELTHEGAKAFVQSLAEMAGTEILAVYALAAIGALLLELLLPVLLLTTRLRWLTCLLGVCFHALIELVDFRIGLFSYFMVGIYLTLMLPDSLVRRAPRLPAESGAPSPALHGLGALVAAAAVAMVPIEGSRLAAVLILVAAALGPWMARGRSLAQGAMGAAVLLLVSSTGLARDYWKYKGGDARRRGDLPVAVQAYEQVTRLDPEYLSGWVRLGDLYRRQELYADAAEAYRRAETLDPSHSTVQSRIRELEALRGSAD